MADGIKIYNDAGTVQIDESYFNLVLIDKVAGTIDMTATDPSTNYAIGAEVACIAVQAWPQTFSVAGTINSGGTWTFRIRFYNNPDTSGTHPYTIYAFGKPPTPSETFGIHVKSATGATIFHSQFKPLRIVAVSASTSGYTAASGQNIAVLTLEPSIYAPGGGGIEGNTFRCDGSQIQASRITIEGSAPSGTGRDGLYAVVDVTNY